MLVDFDLIRQARAGDAAAFNQIVLAYRKRVLGTIGRLIGRPEDVEDVGQDVFVRLTVNAAYDYLRKQRRKVESRMSDLSEQQVLMADAEASGRASHELEYRNRQKELAESLLRDVSEEDRILLTLKEVEGLSLRELQSIYHVNENALKVRLFRARQRVLKAFAARQKDA